MSSHFNFRKTTVQEKTHKKGWTWCWNSTLRRIFLAWKTVWLKKVKTKHQTSRDRQKEPCSQLCDSMSTTQLRRPQGTCSRQSLDVKAPVWVTQSDSRARNKGGGRGKKKFKKAQWRRLSTLGCNAACGCSMCLSLLREITECLLLMRERAAGKTSGILLLPFIGILRELCNGKSVSGWGRGGNWSPEEPINQLQLSQNAAPGSAGLEPMGYREKSKS